MLKKDVVCGAQYRAWKEVGLRHVECEVPLPYRNGNVMWGVGWRAANLVLPLQPLPTHSLSLSIAVRLNSGFTCLKG